MSTLVVDRLLGLLVAASRAEETWKTQEQHWRRFCHWALLHHRRPLPASELTVLGFLASHADQWTYRTALKARTVITQAHRELGLPCPTGPASSGYLSALRYLKGDITPETAQVDDLTPEDLETMAQHREGPQRPTVERDQVTVELSPILQWPTSVVARLTRSHFTIDGSTLTVRGPDGQVVVHHGVDTATLARLQRLMDLATDDATSVLAPNGHGPFRSRLRKVADRAGIERSLDPFPGAAWDEDDRWYAVQFARPDHGNELCRWTAELVGCALARRAAELRWFNTTDFTCDQPALAPYGVSIWDSKTNKGKPAIRHLLQHLDDHGPTCAACALDLWLSVLERRWNHTNGILFPADLPLDGGAPRGRLTTDAITADVRKRYRAAVNGSKWITSRSIRVLAATDAWRAGWALSDIASEITKHDSPASPIHYIRGQQQFHLDV